MNNSALDLLVIIEKRLPGLSIKLLRLNSLKSKHSLPLRIKAAKKNQKYTLRKTI